MNAAITESERASHRPLVTADHAEHHKANARAWYDQYQRLLRGELPAGAEATAIWSAFVRECDLANIDPHDFAATLH